MARIYYQQYSFTFLIMFHSINLKKTLFTFLITTAQLLVLFGQPSVQNDITLLTHTLVGLIPSITGEVGKPDKVGENFFFRTFQVEEGLTATLQVYRYKRPAADTDWLFVSHKLHEVAPESFLNCYALNRQTGAITQIELPFDIPSPSRFNKEEYDENQDYHRIEYTISENGNVLILASPGMGSYCVMLLKWDGKSNFSLFKRSSYDSWMEVDDNYPDSDLYIQNVIRPNVQRINTTSTWDFIEEKEHFDFSIEGASLTYYYSARILEKIVAKIFDQTGSKTVEFFFLNTKLSFVYEVTTFKSGTKTERRWYLNGGYIIRGIGDNGVKLSFDQMNQEFCNRDNGTFGLFLSIIEH